MGKTLAVAATVAGLFIGSAMGADPASSDDTAPKSQGFEVAVKGTSVAKRGSGNYWVDIDPPRRH